MFFHTRTALGHTALMVRNLQSFTLMQCDTSTGGPSLAQPKFHPSVSDSGPQRCLRRDEADREVWDVVHHQGYTWCTLHYTSSLILLVMHYETLLCVGNLHHMFFFIKQFSCFLCKSVLIVSYSLRCVLNVGQETQIARKGIGFNLSVLTAPFPGFSRSCRAHGWILVS